MLVVKLEDHSPKTGKVRELSRIVIDECRGDHCYADYIVALGEDAAPLAILEAPRKRGHVHDFARGEPWWALVAKALRSMGFGRVRGRRET